jgi:hypothetical protein
MPLTLLCQAAPVEVCQALPAPVAACMPAPEPAPPRQRHHRQLPVSGAGQKQPRAPAAARTVPQTCSRGAVDAEGEVDVCMLVHSTVAVQVLASVVSRCRACCRTCVSVDCWTCDSCPKRQQQQTHNSSLVDGLDWRGVLCCARHAAGCWGDAYEGWEVTNRYVGHDHSGIACQQ